MLLSCPWPPTSLSTLKRSGGLWRGEAGFMGWSRRRPSGFGSVPIRARASYGGGNTFCFAHVGISLAVAQAGVLALSRGRRRLTTDEAIFVAVGSMLPDIVDKPVGHVLLPYLLGEGLGSGRAFGHTLVFFVIIITATLLAGPRIPARNRGVAGDGRLGRLLRRGHAPLSGHPPLSRGPLPGHESPLSRNGLLLVALSSGGHLVLDASWVMPEVFLWPAFGVSLQAAGAAGFVPWVGEMLQLLREPQVYIGEILGFFLILLNAFGYLIETRKLRPPVWARNQGEQRS